MADNDTYEDDVDFSNVGLRKRSHKATTLSPIRERSISPGTRASKEGPQSTSWTTPDAPMHTFQTELRGKFPEIYFTDEFCDNELGTTTCLIGGLTCDLTDLTQYNKLPFDFKFEDGRLCLTHTSGSMPEILLKKTKSRVTKRHVAIIMLWLVTISIIVFLMLTFGEKYSELLSHYNI